tara:strand:- start:248 stop:613 length:366 start_codon:yes stop_codon:yes gene_type:complete
MKKISFVLILFFISTKIFAEINAEDKILKNLRCLVCQGQTISDSNSDFAQIIKSVVNDKIQEGLTEKEIYKFLSEKYGDWILYNPPLKRSSFLLWFLPYLVFVVGGVILLLIFKKSLISKK